MLDDLKYLNKVDKGDALGVAGKQADQLLHDFAASFQSKADIFNIVVGGMGGSGWPSLVLRSWPGLTVPFELSSNYHVPSYVNKSTLYIASSYSGNTEETIEALGEAAERGATIVVMAAGGQLAKIAREKKYPLYEIPGGFQPRMSSFFFLAALVQILEPLALIPSGSLKELRDTAAWLNGKNKDWLVDVETTKNPAKQLAEKLVGKNVIVYSGPLLYPAANKWKICINENAKNTAWSNQYPELNHNEFIGWSSHPIEKPFGVVEIQSNLEHPRVQQRFALTERLLSGKRPHANIVTPEGDSVLQQILWSFNLGDYVSLYLAVLNNVDPTPVDLVEKFKKELG
jgi:glucose/mannose-6-phosphate isomerase